MVNLLTRVMRTYIFSPLGNPCVLSDGHKKIDRHCFVNPSCCPNSQDAWRICLNFETVNVESPFLVDCSLDGDSKRHKTISASVPPSRDSTIHSVKYYIDIKVLLLPVSYLQQQRHSQHL